MGKKKDSFSVIGGEHGTNSTTGDDAEVAHKKACRRWRWTLCCFACFGVAIVILSIIVLVLALTVFKVKDPRMTMNKLMLSDFDRGLFNQPGSILTANATLIADISIKNPNAASFSFNNSTTMFYYDRTEVGVASVPGGYAGAHRTARFNATLDVFAERLAAILEANSNETLGLIFGNRVRFNLSSFTEIDGRINIWGLYRRKLKVKMNCTFTLEFPPTTEIVENKDCRAAAG